jgi:hypothetical protein
VAFGRSSKESNPRYSLADHIDRLAFKDPAEAEKIAEGVRKAGLLGHFPLMLIHSLRVGRHWRILADKRREGANEFCARGPVSSAQPPFAAVL